MQPTSGVQIAVRLLDAGSSGTQRAMVGPTVLGLPEGPRPAAAGESWKARPRTS